MKSLSPRVWEIPLGIVPAGSGTAWHGSSESRAAGRRHPAGHRGRTAPHRSGRTRRPAVRECSGRRLRRIRGFALQQDRSSRSDDLRVDNRKSENGEARICDYDLGGSARVRAILDSRQFSGFGSGPLSHQVLAWMTGRPGGGRRAFEAADAAGPAASLQWDREPGARLFNPAGQQGDDRKRSAHDVSRGRRASGGRDHSAPENSSCRAERLCVVANADLVFFTKSRNHEASHARIASCSSWLRDERMFRDLTLETDAAVRA